MPVIHEPGQNQIDDSLRDLLERGRRQGYLTYGQVNDYLPDTYVNPEKLDQLLTLLENHHIELIEGPEGDLPRAAPTRGQLALLAGELSDEPGSEVCPGCGQPRPAGAFLVEDRSPRHGTRRVQIDHCVTCMAVIRETCPACREFRPLIDFHYRVRSGAYLRSRHCIECDSRAHRVSRRNGSLGATNRISAAEYLRLSEEQKGACALCRRGLARHLEPDYARGAGPVRGLLCGACRQGLGLFQDDPALLRRAARYLGRPAEEAGA
jgi:Autographiviridae endonuclease VII